MEEVCIVIDVGPEKPIRPLEPAPPQGAPGTPAWELAYVRWRCEITDSYAPAYAKFLQDARAYEADGPYPKKVRMEATDAMAAFMADGRAVHEKRQSRRRYYIRPVDPGYLTLIGRGGVILPDTFGKVA